MTDYARRVARRWYIVVASVVIAVGLVFLHAVSGSNNTATATASIYLGQPLASGGGGVITADASVERRDRRYIRQVDGTLADAARAAHLTAGKLHGHVSVLATSPSAGGTAGSASKTTSGSPTISITVEGPWSRPAGPGGSAVACDSLIGFENRYADIKRGS